MSRSMYRCYSTTSTYQSTEVLADSVEDASEQYEREYGFPPALILDKGGYWVYTQLGTYAWNPTT